MAKKAFFSNLRGVAAKIIVIQSPQIPILSFTFEHDSFYR